MASIFEYGLTNSLGSTISGVPATLTSAGTFSVVLTGLTPNTTYYFRADATGNGTDYGAIQTFTTAPSGSTSPPRIDTLAATNITANSATLNGNLRGLGSASSVASIFEYGLTNSLGSTIRGVPATLTSAGTFSEVLTGLAPNTTYYFRADATGNGTDYGAIQTFTTAQ